MELDDDEPMPLPQKVPSFIDNPSQSASKSDFKKGRHTVNEKHIKRSKGTLTVLILCR